MESIGAYDDSKDVRVISSIAAYRKKVCLPTTAQLG